MKDERHRKFHHPHQDQVIRRLKRAEGHLRSTIAMTEEGRSCITVAQQLQAVESAVANARKLLIQDHVDHCLAEAAARPRAGTRELIDEFKAVAQLL